jgi:hypothetical protein
MSRKSSLLKVLIVALLLLAMAASSPAQIKSSAITGSVTDQSGALVPNATVLVTNEDTNVELTVKTNDADVYSAPYLAAGHYRVTVTAGGFQAFRNTGIIIGTSTTVRVDAVLVPGSVSTSIDVKATTEILQTENAMVQSAVNSDVIAAIPNINNNPIYYATLQAGVVGLPKMYTSSVLGVGYNDRMSMSSVRINGGELGSNDVQLDGVSVQGSAWHEATVMPDRDALQEVRVAANGFAADQGTGQGLISMTTKSGTNQFHGTLRYRVRNEDLNANGRNNNMRGIARPKYRLNEGGGTIGGPVIIPKLFNGKDKVFFFASYAQLSHGDPVVYQGNVPTDLQRKGDLSQTMVADVSGKPTPVQIFDPFSAVPYQDSSTVFIRTAFPGNVVPTPNQYGLKLLQSYPEPNHPATDAFGTNNYMFVGSTPTTRKTLSTRLDLHPSAKNSIYMTGGLQRGHSSQPNRWGANSTFVNMAFPGQVVDDNPYAAVGDTLVLNPTTLLDVRYGLTRIYTNTSYPATTGFDYSAYGMPSMVAALSPMFGTVPSHLNMGGPFSNLNNDAWNRKMERQTNHVLAGSVTKIVNRWTIKTGGEYRVYFGNWQDLNTATPQLTLSNNSGQLGGLSGGNSSLTTNPAMNGIGFVSALTGVGGYALTAGTGSRPALAAKYVAFYSQNDWKATDRLTINLGLRYEVQPGPTERYNHMSGVDLSRTSPFTDGGSFVSPMGALGRIVFPGTEGYSRNLWDTQWNNISPRVGFAYRWGSSTVVRGGYGRAYAPSNSGFNANGLIYGTGPYSPGTVPNAYGTSPNGVPIGTFADPQNTILQLAPGATQAAALYGNNNGTMNVDLIPRNYKNTLLSSWNLFIERRMRGNWLLSVGYVGNHGTDEPWRTYPLTGTFTIPDSTLMPWRAAWLASSGLSDPAQVQVSNPIPALIGRAAGSINGKTISTLNSQMPYLDLLGQTVLANMAMSNYNALRVKAEHAYSNGLSAAFNYTWAKATGLTGGPYGSAYAESQAGSLGMAPMGGVNYRNLNNDRGLLNYDVTHRFVAVVSYQTPFGKGGRFELNNSVLRAIAGGWQLGTVVTLQGGQPWGPNCSGTLNSRCNVVAGQPVEVPADLQHWYDGKTSVTLPDGRVVTPPAFTFLKWNPDRFALPVVQFPNGKYATDQYQWGTTSMAVNGLRTPGFYNTNLNVTRQFRIRESIEMELMAEATNALNRTNFNPNSVNGSVSAILAPNPATNSQPGQNANAASGTLGTNFLEPRQITLSLRLRF